MSTQANEDYVLIEPSFSKEPSLKESSLKRKREAFEEDQAALDLRRQKQDLDNKKIRVMHDRLELLDKLVGRYHDACDSGEDPAHDAINSLLKDKLRSMLEEA